MAGIIATLRKEDNTVEGGYRYYPGGYIHITSFSGSLGNKGPGFEEGEITINTLTYLAKADFDADHADFITPNKGGVVQFQIPYVPNADPVKTAIVELKSWFPDAVEVD